MRYTLEQFQQTYDTVTQTVRIGEKQLSFFKPDSIDRFIDADNTLENFPLWAKLWESSAVLCTFLADLPVVPGRRLLEIGAGMGVAGIAAASLGHDITLTEHNADALHFIRANAELNGYPNLSVHRLDWNRPDLGQLFDLIIGSEITYKEQNFPVLKSLFSTLLAPGGAIVLAESVRATGGAFMDAMEPDFKIRVRRHRLRFANQSQTVVLFEMQPRHGGGTAMTDRSAGRDGT